MGLWLLGLVLVAAGGSSPPPDSFPRRLVIHGKIQMPDGRVLRRTVIQERLSRSAGRIMILPYGAVVKTSYDLPVQHTSPRKAEPQTQVIPMYGKLRLTLEETRDVELRMYNVLGREVVRWRKPLPPGMHILTFPHLTPGVYFVRLRMGDHVFRHRMVIGR